MIASQKNYHQIVEYLASHGADVDQRQILLQVNLSDFIIFYFILFFEGWIFVASVIFIKKKKKKKKSNGHSISLYYSIYCQFSLINF